MIKKVEELKLEINREIKLVKTTEDAKEVYKKYFGKEGRISIELREMIKNAENKDKKIIGPLINEIKESSIKKLNKIKERLEIQKLKTEMENKRFQFLSAMDMTSTYKLIENQKLIKKGNFGGVTNSPLLNFILLIEEFFSNLQRNLKSDKKNDVLRKTKDLIKEKKIEFSNDSDLTSPLETTEFNFKRLNIDETHPAWSKGDVFLLKNSLLLRSHCTSSTARQMEENKNKEFSSYTIGNVLRPDNDDATHSHQFVQLDAIVIASQISVWQLQDFLQSLLNYLFSKNVKTRFRPSYFPFTSPSFEVDIKCENLSEDCGICKGTGWIEVLGGGMVDKDVFLKAGYTEDVIREKNLTGWAFGLGVDRLLCLVKNISDIRTLYR